MMRTVLGFCRGLLTLARPWWVWIGLLGLVNFLLPLFFLGTPEGRMVLGAFLVAAALQMAIFHAKGFVRLLGLGHLVAWVPLLAWLAGRLASLPADSALYRWVLAVLVLDGISLLIDAVDVVRYLRGERPAAAGGAGPPPQRDDGPGARR